MDYSAFQCKWIGQNQLRELADQKRQKYWPEGILPVDTTKIIELRLRLEVEPMFNLLSELDVDAYLKTDLSGIVVDHECYMNDKFLNRLRFSMAHELGHYFLHREIYSVLSLSSLEDWKEFIQNVPETEYEAFEYQANEFAGRFLVPHEKLKSAIMDSIEMIRRSGIEHMLSDSDMVLSRISPFLRRIFGVSEQVIEIRVRREKLWPPNGLG